MKPNQRPSLNSSKISLGPLDPISKSKVKRKNRSRVSMLTDDTVARLERERLKKKNMNQRPEAWKTKLTNLITKSKNKSQKYSGDVFSSRGDYTEGITYLSRRTLKRKSLLDTQTANIRSIVNAKHATNDFNLKAQNNAERRKKIEARRRSVTALYSLTKEDGFEQQIISEGGLRAINILCSLRDLTINQV